MSVVLTRTEGAILYVTLNRPERLNALHAPAHEELAAVFDEFEGDPALRVAVVSGAGRAFCAGNDLKWQAAGGSMARPATGFAGLTLRHDRSKPVIAAVNGVALGGGCEIVLACDIAVAAQSARFGLTEAKFGLVPLAGVHLLPRRVGLKDAMGLLLTGRVVPAETALRMGMVNEMVPDAELVAAVADWAQRIAEVSPQSVKACLTMVRQSLGFADMAAAMGAPDPALERLRASADFIEGPRAFAEGRTPEWTQ